MSFSSLDDLITEMSSGKTYKGLYQKLSPNAAAGAVGRFYDLWLGAATAGRHR